MSEQVTKADLLDLKATIYRGIAQGDTDDLLRYADECERDADRLRGKERVECANVVYTRFDKDKILVTESEVIAKLTAERDAAIKERDELRAKLRKSDASLGGVMGTAAHVEFLYHEQRKRADDAEAKLAEVAEELACAQCGKDSLLRKLQASDRNGTHITEKLCAAERERDEARKDTEVARDRLRSEVSRVSCLEQINSELAAEKNRAERRADAAEAKMATLAKDLRAVEWSWKNHHGIHVYRHHHELQAELAAIIDHHAPKEEA